MSAGKPTDEERLVPLSEADLALLQTALNEILNGRNAIEEWEFQTRTGLERDDAPQLIKRIGNVLASRRANW
jgi:hypothetical protein